MANIYGVYKKARNASWQALIDNRVDSLPVDVVKIVGNNGIKLLKDSQTHELRSGEAGISVFDGTQWYIVAVYFALSSSICACSSFVSV